MSIKKTDEFSDMNQSEHLVRERMNQLLLKACEKPLVIVCAGAGYGKTRAVYDFTRATKVPTLWIQFSDHDNNASRFWESLVHALIPINKPFADEIKSLGFPDSEDKLKRYFDIRVRHLASFPQYLIVLDDLYLIHNSDVITYIEWLVQETLANHSTILISRDMPRVNIAGLQVGNGVSIIQEKDLNFTENELSIYLDRQGISVNPQVLHEIFQDTQGWAFSANLIALSLKKAPGYSGYARSAMKQNTFSLIDAEVWNTASEQLKHFLAGLSLIDHLSADLIHDLLKEDDNLMTEFKLQNAYIRYDSYTNTYLIHHLFLDFLHAKQDILTDDEKRRIYSAAARWCMKNSYIIDALGYCEKIGDYESIVSIFYDFPFYLPYDFALYGLELFERVPDEMFFKVDFLAVMHLRVILCLGRPDEFTTLSAYYEQRFFKLPENNTFRKHTLGFIWYFRGLMDIQVSITENRYNFDKPFAKMNEYLSGASFQMGKWLALNTGSCVSWIYSAKQGAPQDYLETTARMIESVNPCFGGFMSGLDELGWGELKFYQGNIGAATPLITTALEYMREHRQFDTIFMSLFYIMRMAFVSGKTEQAEQALESIKALLKEENYIQRYTNCDIALGWYYYILRQPEKIPNWLKDKFLPYGHAFYQENFGNQMKVRFHFMAKNFVPMLTYIDGMKQRESILFNRIEMLAIEACARYQMKDKAGAFSALQEAYETASSNDIITPFIELGKDMRTLTLAALHDSDCKIPKPWLEMINKKSHSYARYQTMMISGYKNKNDVSVSMPLSPRETETLHDLYAGFTRAEIASRQNLSINTVNMNIRSLYTKLNANNVADIIRIAVEKKLV